MATSCGATPPSRLEISLKVDGSKKRMCRPILSITISPLEPVGLLGSLLPAAKPSAAAVSPRMARNTRFRTAIGGLYPARRFAHAPDRRCEHAIPPHQSAGYEQKRRHQSNDYPNGLARPSSEVAKVQVAQPADNLIARAE